MNTENKTLEQVKQYYGKVLKSKNDLATGACCSSDAMPSELVDLLPLIEPEILQRDYGCGSSIPPALEGCTVLDLGCGTGKDVYLTSNLVGETGFVIGLDMTDEQLSVARKHRDTQMQRFGFSKPNVDFRHGYIEDLAAAGIEDNSVDVVISNCAINLSPDKRAAFSEIFRVLKPGGELYFSDVFSGRRISESLLDDPVLYGECLAGAMYIEDFRRMLRDLGCLDYREISRSRIDLGNRELADRLGRTDFYSITVRAFKLPALEDLCEDYGQVATYRGTIPNLPHQFTLDDHHIFIAKKPMLVCGNTAAMLEETRYGEHFIVQGDRSIHFGLFDCAPAYTRVEDDGGAGGCCC